MQELRGRFLIKGKRLNKLEASFAEEVAAGEDTDVTEEDESGSDSENDEEPKESKVRVSSGRFKSLCLVSALALVLNSTPSLSSGSRRRS